MKDQKEILEIYNGFKKFLNVKEPDLISLKSCFSGLGFPNYDKRGVHNFANEIEEYYMDDFRNFIRCDELSYNSFYEWVITQANHDQLISLFSKLPFEIENLFYLDKDISFNDDYEIYHFEDIISDPIAQNKEFLTEYFHEISQVSDQLILLNKPGNDEDSEIYDINGKCISDLIYSKISFELDEDNLYGGCFIKSINKDNLILIKQCGNPYYDGTIRYLFQWNGEEIELMKIIEEDFELDTTESHLLAKEISKLFVDSLKGQN